MIKQTLFLFLVLNIYSAYACEDIEGIYKSDSETHWSFELVINKTDAKLTYETYWYGNESLRVDEKVISEAICKKESDGYLLTFGDKVVKIKHHALLNYTSFAQKGGVPGITGNFFPNREVELWLKAPNT